MRSGLLQRVFALLLYAMAFQACVAFAADGPTAEATRGDFAGTKAG